MTVVFPHHKLAHIAGAELRAQAAAPHKVAKAASHLKHPVGEGEEQLPIAAYACLKAVELLERHILPREEVSLTVLAPCQSMSNSRCRCLHMDEALAPFGRRHEGLR